MSHSQFRRVKTYTETCMDESLRQAYDYWQDQPGSIRRENPGDIKFLSCHLNSQLSSSYFLIPALQANLQNGADLRSHRN